MTLNCLLKNGTKKNVRVPIEPPLSGYNDVKHRLLEMKAVAQEGLGMVRPNMIPVVESLIVVRIQIKTPVIRTFEYPSKVTIGIIIPLAFAYLGYTPANSTHPFFLPAQVAAPYVGNVPKAFLKGYFGIHAVETLYTLRLCQKHQTGFVVGVSNLLVRRE